VIASCASSKAARLTLKTALSRAVIP